MANKFTKLNIGDAVASSGGRVWKKLSSMPPLSVPTLSLNGDILTITENSGLATSFDILVDGEVKYTYAKYLYNGVELPPIPNLQGYPYCWIRKHTTNGQYQLVFAPSPWYYKDNAVCCSDSSATEPWYNITISTAHNATEWIFYKHTTGTFGIDDARPVFWSNHDIPNGSATATDIYFEGTEPELSETSLTKGTVDLSTLGLSEGTHSITVISKADGYPNSAESEAVSYEELGSVAGTWIFNDVLTKPASDFTILLDSESALFTFGGSTTYWQITTRITDKYWLKVVQTGYISTDTIYDDEGWRGSNYKTIVFKPVIDNIATREFAKWLKANATKTA